MDVKRFTPRAIGCKNISLGKQGETNAVRVEFLCAEWLNEYPAARIELHVTIPDGTAYTAKLEESGSTRAWNVTEPYTAQAGSGMIELILRDAATSTVIKSVTGRTHVEKSPSGDGQPAPPPDENGLNGYVRYDRAQALTEEERKRARENIGADGAGGVGGYYKPSVDAEGNLTWEKSAEAMPDAESANIRGPEGKEGKTGATGPQGPQGTAGNTPYIGENGNWWIAGGDTGTPATPQGGGVPDGGAAGQFLVKKSNADGDAGWSPLTTATLKSAQYGTWNGNTTPQSIPDGITYVDGGSDTEATGFPVGYCTCIAVKNTVNRAFQLLVEKTNGRMRLRSATDGSAWGEWQEYARKSDTVSNSSKLGGKEPSAYVQTANVLNTLEEVTANTTSGMVAGAGAVKELKNTLPGFINVGSAVTLSPEETPASWTYTATYDMWIRITVNVPSGKIMRIYINGVNIDFSSVGETNVYITRILPLKTGQRIHFNLFDGATPYEFTATGYAML